MEATMNLSAPKVITWWVAVILGALGILSYLVTVPVLSGFAFWLVAIGFVIFVVATLVKGL
jgi:hypothetical protein